jgi:small subunit ribosomal protein S27e
MKPLVKLPKSKFLAIQCKKCKNEQIVFSKASTKIKCLKCGEVLVEPTGGEARIKAKVLKVLG